MGIFFFMAQCVYLMVPGMVANMMPVIVRPYFSFLDKPVDGGRLFRGKTILGSHKTWRGFIFGVGGAIIAALVQTSLYEQSEFFENLSLIPYNERNFVVVGVTMGMGALLGDAVKSFFKRQLSVAPGQRFFPWDQLDSVIGGLILLPIVYVPSWYMAVTSVLLAFISHVTIRHVGYWLKIAQTKW